MALDLRSERDFAVEEVKVMISSVPRNKMLSVSRTAKLIRRSRNTVYNLIESGQLDRSPIGGWKTVSSESVIRYLKSKLDNYGD